MITPVVVVTLSSSRSRANAPSRNNRRPEPSTSGAPEQQRPALGHPLPHHPAHDLVVIGQGPAALPEAAAGVLVGR
jgi:hypothetical protein